MNLEENFIKYIDITLIIIGIVKTEEYEKLDENFQQRQLILDDISKINCSKEELKEFYLKYEIKNIEKKLAFEMRDKRDGLLVNIKENKKRQAGMTGYNNLSSKAVFLSKQV